MGGVDVVKKVEFVRIHSDLNGFGLGKGTKYYFGGAEETIKEYIENGWSFEWYVPIQTRGAGDIEIISLVFQKEE